MAGQRKLQGKHIKYIKFGMYILALIMAVLGLSLGGVGVWIRVDFNATEYRNVIDPVFTLCHEIDEHFDFSISVHLDAIAYFLIFLGVTILGMCCIGLCGTIRERQSYIGMFAILLFVVFAVLLTAAAQAIGNKDVFVTCEDEITERLQETARQSDELQVNQDFIDHVERHVGCCGVTGYSELCQRNDTVTVLPTCDVAIITFFNSVTINVILILVVSLCLGLLTVVGIGMSAYLFISLRQAKLKE